MNDFIRAFLSYGLDAVASVAVGVIFMALVAGLILSVCWLLQWIAGSEAALFIVGVVLTMPVFLVVGAAVRAEFF